jgi:hypothetical protein
MEFNVLQEKYDEALSQIRSKDLKNAELIEMISTLKRGSEHSATSSILQNSYQFSAIENNTPKQYIDFSASDEICNEVARELQLQSPKDILARVIHLKEYYNYNKEFRKLYKKLAECMIQKIGRKNFTDLPSCTNLWKWVSGEIGQSKE